MCDSRCNDKNVQYIAIHEILIEYHLNSSLIAVICSHVFVSVGCIFRFYVFVVPPLDPPFVHSEPQTARTKGSVLGNFTRWVTSAICWEPQTKNWDIGKFARSSTRVLPASFQLFCAVNQILHREMLPILFPIVLIHFFWVVVGIGVAGSILSKFHTGSSEWLKIRDPWPQNKDKSLKSVSSCSFFQTEMPLQWHTRYWHERRIPHHKSYCWRIRRPFRQHLSSGGKDPNSTFGDGKKNSPTGETVSFLRTQRHWWALDLESLNLRSSIDFPIKSADMHH